MIKRIIIGVVLVILVVAAPAASKPSALDVGRCLKFTTAEGLRTARILSGLPITAEQARELKSRLSRYGSLSGYEGINDLGLSPDVVAEINRRIQVQVKEWNRYPLGYPCLVFKAPAQTKAFVRELLVDNGFRPASVSIRKTSPRQFQLRGIQDGVELFGIVAKSGKRQIVVYLTSTDSFAQTKRFATSFEP